MTYEFKNMPQEDIFKILEHAKTIAVVGASADESKSSNMIARGLQADGYRVIPVNPMLAGQELFGEKVYANIKDVPEHIDIVDIFRRSEFLADVARDFIETDADVYWAQQGLESEEAEKILRDAGRDQIIMNRCIKIEYAYSGLRDKK
jgi:predicted CoA-binding protein